MSSSLKLVTLALLCVNVTCLPGPDPGTYNFSTVGATEKEVPAYDPKKRNLERSERAVSNNIILVGGGSNKEGNVLLNGKPICDYKWDDKDAKVVCRMLGFSSDGAFATTQSQFGLVSRDFIMDDVQCKGEETDIRDCYHRDKDNCGAGDGAGVRCRVSPFDDELKEELEEIKDENEELQTQLSALMTKLNALETSVSNQETTLTNKLDGLSQNLTELGSTVNFDEHVFGNLIIAFNDSLTSLKTKTALNSKNIEGISTEVKAKMENVTQDVVDLKASDQKQETKIGDNIENLKSVSTYGKWCGYQDAWGRANYIINYDSLKFSSSNMDIISTPLNIGTGIFTVPVSGAWRVTYSMRSMGDAGESNKGFIYLNNNQLPESEHWTHSSQSRALFTGGREVTLAATAGDTIYFKTATIKEEYSHVYFCVAFEHGSNPQSRFSARDEEKSGPEYQDHFLADVEDIPGPDYQDPFPADEEAIPGTKYQDHFSAGDEEYFSAYLEKSTCASNADCPPHLACIRSVLSSDPGTCGDPWCWREEWDCGSGARCIISNHKPLCV